MLALRPSEVRALVENGRLDAILVRGRWLISAESIQRLDAGDASAPDLRRLEARVAELEKRLDSVHPGDAEESDLRPALQPLFRSTE